MPYAMVDLFSARLMPPFLGAEVACAGMPTAMFYPESMAKAAVAPARRICARCKVLERCLEWAVETGQEHGVWGGTTRAQRDRIRQNRGIIC